MTATTSTVATLAAIRDRLADLDRRLTSNGERLDAIARAIPKVTAP